MLSHQSHQLFETVFQPHASLLAGLARGVLERQQSLVHQFQAILSRLDDSQPSRIELDRDRLTIGRAADLTVEQHEQLDTALQQLKPWRKGPFNIFGRQIDSEWNSALKWRRIEPHIAPIDGRKVLDVGSSNGYHGFRMVARQPQLVLGIEPYLTYYFQYCLLQKYIASKRMHCLPLKLQNLTPLCKRFDTVFCMGLLYHSRSPLDTLAQLHALLVPGGELILETLVMQAHDEYALFPKDRYACMRNVYFIPSVACLCNWLRRSRFKRIRCVDITRTSLDEQRKTDWIDSESLEDFLDPADCTRTIEGYPAPVRAVVLAEATSK